MREDTAVLLYTGGTTGVSKGVELSHRNLLINAEQNRVWAGIRDGSEITLAAVPLFHGFGLTCCLNLGILTGATIVLVPNPTDTQGLIQTIEQHRPTIFPVVPTMLVAISHFPDIAEHNLRSVRVCPCAGSPLAPAVQRTFIERTGVRPVEGYGLTEAAPVTHGNPPFGDDRHGTIGLPYPGTVARVVDFETGKLDMPFAGDWTQPGEIIIKGPQIMKGYWNRPEETAAQLRDGWLHTGDIGQMHRDGYFRVVDRLKDMIIRSGMNIYPAEVEAVLHEHPKVLEALVIGIPDAARGELVKAFVVPRDGVEISEEEILAFCRQNMAKYKVPAAVEIRAGLVSLRSGQAAAPRFARGAGPGVGMSADAGPTNALVTGISALVSGATGFLGGHLLGQAARKGISGPGVGPARPAISPAWSVPESTSAQGMSLDRPSLRRAMAGQQLVFHTAGKVSDWGSRREFWQANVEGTANVIAACREAGVKRLIHVSSLTVLGLPRSGDAGR